MSPSSTAFVSEAVASRLAALTMTEFEGAVRMLPLPARRAALAPLWPLARKLGRELAAFDADVGVHGLPNAARVLLHRLGARVQVSGHVPARGAALVVANHPGAYDALSFFAAAQRRDVRLLVAEREFLRALPCMQQHFVYVADVPPVDGAAATPGSADGALLSRASGLRHVMRVWRDGGCVLHFSAGAIEPDPAFVSHERSCFLQPQRGTDLLMSSAQRAHASVHACVISHVHSGAAKRSWIVRAAERRGVTTLAGLLQVAWPAYQRVEPRVRFGAALPPSRLAPAQVYKELHEQLHEQFHQPLHQQLQAERQRLLSETPA